MAKAVCVNKKAVSIVLHSMNPTVNALSKDLTLNFKQATGLRK